MAPPPFTSGHTHIKLLKKRQLDSPAAALDKFYLSVPKMEFTQNWELPRQMGQ